jgi:cytoskeletal protein CcmA (bactofilin family)
MSNSQPPVSNGEQVSVSRAATDNSDRESAAMADAQSVNTFDTSLPNSNERQAAPVVQPKPMVRSLPLRAVQRQKEEPFKPKLPVITGEATYRGTLAVEGSIAGQLGPTGGLINVKQRPRTAVSDTEPELDGALSFKDMLRVNGHIAGKVFSANGTLIVDASALVDADIDVAIAIIDGTVNGDVVARHRAELGVGARINGNIWTRSLSMKPGAVFEGECKMLSDKEDVKSPQGSVENRARINHA